MSRNRRIAEGPPPLDLIEEAFHCLRRAPMGVWLVYYGGALPFVLALLYFWADMSRGAFAQERLLGSTFVMTALFIWMKTCQCRFAAHLEASLCGRRPAAWGLVGWLEVGLHQSIWQPVGMFLLPAALVLFAPFGWVYAFFQNLSALDRPRGNQEGGPLAGRAWRQALLWPGQNHAALFAIKGFGLFVFLNLVLATLAIPQLLKILLGVETPFSRVMSDPVTLIMTIFNTTFLSVMVGLTYLAVDPFLKTFYVLRCFYGESLRTGQDLQAELNRWRVVPAGAVAAVLLLGWVCSVGCLQAAEPEPAASPEGPVAVDASRLDRAIEDVLSSREYRWRLPRLAEEPAGEKGMLVLITEELIKMLKSTFRTVGGWIEKVLKWVLGNRTGPGNGGGARGWERALRFILLLLAVTFVFLVVLLLVRTWRQRDRSAGVQATALPQLPDLTDENVAADQLPEHDWLRMARELLAQGDLRLALRAMYLASLAHLSERQFLTIAKFKSNFDYLRELQRRAHLLPELWQTFSENVTTFDRVWYGSHPVDASLFDRFSRNVDRLRQTA